MGEGRLLSGVRVGDGENAVALAAIETKEGARGIRVRTTSGVNLLTAQQARELLAGLVDALGALDEQGGVLGLLARIAELEAEVNRLQARTQEAEYDAAVIAPFDQSEHQTLLEANESLEARVADLEVENERLTAWLQKIGQTNIRLRWP